MLKVSGGENHWNSAPDMGDWNSLGYRAWIQQGEVQDTNTGDTVVGDGGGGRKNGTLLSPANIVLLSFHIAKSVNIRREDASVLESYFLKRATPVSRKQAGKNNDFFLPLVEYKIEPGASVYSDYKSFLRLI